LRSVRGQGASRRVAKNPHAAVGGIRDGGALGHPRKLPYAFSVRNQHDTSGLRCCLSCGSGKETRRDRGCRGQSEPEPARKVSQSQRRSKGTAQAQHTRQATCDKPVAASDLPDRNAVSHRFSLQSRWAVALGQVGGRRRLGNRFNGVHCSIAHVSRGTHEDGKEGSVHQLCSASKTA
jgi:hypothetical protein